jgi:hypothetical protein
MKTIYSITYLEGKNNQPATIVFVHDSRNTRKQTLTMFKAITLFMRSPNTKMKIISYNITKQYVKKI